MSDHDKIRDAFGVGASEAPGPAPSPVPGEEPHGPDPDEVAAEVAHAIEDAKAHEPEGQSEDFTPEMVDALVAERDQFLEAYQRTAADFDNFRKVSQKRIADEVTRSLAAFVERMLPVLDAIDAARAHGDVTESDPAAGVEAVANALYAQLEKEGLSRVDPAGQPFDPEVAEAVMHEPGDGEPTVTEVLRTGYLWNGRVIRPAMVKVSG